MSKIKEHYEYEINKLQITEKRLRDEISNKQADLKTLKAKLQTFEQSKASLEKKETHTVLENDKLNRALQNEKQKNDDLGKKMLQELEESSKKIEQANKKIQKIEPQYVILKGYAIKLEAHYKTKKGEFAEEIHMASNRFECDIRTLREELIFYKEKANKLEFENKQLAIQKDVQNQEDYLRRASIDSLSRGLCGESLGNQSSNVGSYQKMPALNRFNAISENDCEESTVSHKFIEMTDNTRRISQLQTHNRQVPRHLQSSIAVEDVIKIINENFVLFMDTTFNKENHRVRRFFWLKMKSLKSGYIYIKIYFF